MQKCIDEILNGNINGSFLYTIISAIAGRVVDPRDEVRMKALESLFGGLRKIGNGYNSEQ